MKYTALTGLLLLAAITTHADPRLLWISDNAENGSSTVTGQNGEDLAIGTEWVVQLINTETDEILLSSTAGFQSAAGLFIETPEADATWNGLHVKTRIYDAATVDSATAYAEFSTATTLSWSIDPAPPGTLIYNAGSVSAAQWQTLNEAPIAQDGTASVNEDEAIAITLQASDSNGDSLNYTLESQTSNGSLSLSGSEATYQPDANFNGTDQFTFSVNDGSLDSNIATVYITVIPVNDAPSFNNATLSGSDAQQGTAYSGSVAGSATDLENDTLTYSATSGPAWLTISADGSLSGTPAYADIGANSWTLQVSDGQGGNDTAQLEIAVAANGGDFTTSGDIGTPGAAGSMSFDGTTYTIEGAGSDIWSTSDHFFFASQDHSSDGELIVRVDSIEAINTWTKAGVMFRETRDADAAFVMLIQRPDNQVCMQWRSSTGASAAWSGSMKGGTDAPKWIKLTRDGDLFTGYYSLDGEAWTLMTQVTVAMATDIQAGLAVTSHSSATLCTATFSQFALSNSPMGYFSNAQDIGSPGLSGSFMHVASSYVLEGGGNDIWGTADNFYFASQQRSGDVEISTRVIAVENSNGWAKGGVMFRDSLETGAMHVAIVVRPDLMISMQWRDATNGSCGYQLVGDSTNMKWVKLTRTGDSFTGSYSIDGTTWTAITTVTVAMAADAEVGLAVTSHNDSTLCEASFTELEIK